MDITHIEKKEARIFAQLVSERRATQHFLAERVPDEVIATALEIASQAPSGYNFQPWRFLVLTESGQRAKLKQAAFGQEKIGEAPVVIVAFAQRTAWKAHSDEIFRVAAARRGIPPGNVEGMKKGALGFVDSMPPAVWLNRQVMIGFTHLMLAFEALGWDTAPMEGFDGNAVKKNLQLPEDAEVVALLAVGRARDPQPHPGRLSIDQIAFRETIDQPFTSQEQVTTP
jgi:nitroreductase